MNAKHRKSEERPNMCVYCDQVFSQRFLLDHHECYICEHCHHVEKTKANLQSHIQTMHMATKVCLEQISYLICDFCDYMQAQYSVKKTHNGKPFGN